LQAPTQEESGFQEKEFRGFTDGVRAVNGGLLILGAAFIVTLPIWLGEFWLYIAVTALIYSILALGLNVSVGVCRQANFGVTPFFALAAYLVANVTLRWNVSFIIVLLGSTIATGIVAYLIGLLMLRLRQFTLALGTFVLATAVYDYLNSGLPSYLGGGASGISANGTSIFGSSSIGDAGFYLSFACLCLVLLVLRLTMRSRVGRAWLALGKDELAASMNGIHVRRYAVLAYSVSGAVAGLAGALFAYTLGSVGPDNFSVTVTITVLLMIVLGGLGTLAGPVIGAIFITFLNQGLQSLFSLSYPTLFDGLIIVAIIRFAPGGVAGQFNKLMPARMRTL
jgi:branched-chain amino acid transport system permease protein